ncbi:MAG: twin-arginine translocase TatA/TatE family subunit [Nitrospirota bacterium]|nr:twin-arginine translocase TatA/TatE family subunit [Nitrospirota bacterium]MDH5773970.1 twin-arginine translocase TatA/TatE family subunit [Nitrospirota bacterium]
MFGTMGFSELMIILVIILIIFGAGRLPQIGEGVGKALKGFKKEVADLPSALDPNDPQAIPPTGEPIGATITPTTQPSDVPPVAQAANQPFQPGPEQTPGTAAALLYQGAGPKPAQQPLKASQVSASAPNQSSMNIPGPISMEDRLAQPAPTASAQYPPLPPGAQTKPLAKRPSAIVNKQAVARVQAQQAARKAQAATTVPQDMQSFGEGLGSAVRTFRDAAADIQNSIDPQMRTIQAELESAELEMKESIEMAKQPLTPKEPSGSV